jgi:1-acyl-sn-glycerol-3-phosphate acyltransferase
MVTPHVTTGARGSRLTAIRSRKEQHLQQGNASKASRYIRGFRIAVRTIFLALFSVRVIGKEKIPRTPVIICANHLGWTDVFLVLLFFPIEPRVYVMGEQEVKYISAFRRRIIDSLEVFVMLDRSKPVEALRTMEDIMRRGGSILLFPEGQLGTREGELLELHHGAAHTSVMMGMPILPVGLTGSSQLWLRRRLIMRIGDPISPDSFEGDTRERSHAMTRSLAASMCALLPGDWQHARVKILRRWLTKLL